MPQTPGPRDHLLTARLEQQLSGTDPESLVISPLDSAESSERLARHVLSEVRRALADGDDAGEKVAAVNVLLRQLANADTVSSPPRVLEAIKSRTAIGGWADPPRPPSIPFSQSDLLVNAEGQPQIGAELRTELATADWVDLICAFVIWSGVRHLRDAVSSVIARGGRVRVITTTYMGATEARAVDELVRLGAEVRVAFDARTTKLHAKAWLLERESGLSTAFVGSSNLSHTALFDGLEWNVRLSSIDAPHVIDRVRMTFESHWQSEHFEPYDPETRGEDLRLALRDSDRRSLGERTTISYAHLEVRAYPHQQRMLDALTVERERHDRHRNLVVAATGTGKTVVAALDYVQLCVKLGRRPSLLFIAHREQILRQSLDTYRAVLRDGDFGALHGGGRVAGGEHVFAMVQTLAGVDVRDLAADRFDVVVVDEFHHAAAPTYARLLEHLKPQELLGLTATPERLDGADVTSWFGGRIACELRLWEAIDQGFLVPFQYFGIADGTDLRQLGWRRGGYAIGELSDVLTGDTTRVRRVLSALERIVDDIGTMKALGFCVSVEHARFMEEQFNLAGVRSASLSGEDDAEQRQGVLSRLRRGDLQCVFSVEVLGEGVDVPDVDTILLLRPTQSSTVFSQQLGRGLRRADRKSHLTVIDLIGQHRREFRFEDRLRAIVDVRHGSVREQLEAGFPFLPSGCTLDLDRTSTELVLDNLRSATRFSRWSALVEDLKRMDGVPTLTEFLDSSGHRLPSVYRNHRSWTQLRRDAGKPVSAPRDSDLEQRLLRAIARQTHVDDPERVTAYRAWLRKEDPPAWAELDDRRRRLLTMFAWNVGQTSDKSARLSPFLDALWREPSIREELVQLLEYLDTQSSTLARPAPLPPGIPLTPHARYTRPDILAALGHGEELTPKTSREGVLWVEQAQADVFFVDLQKSARDYSPTTMYRDYAISPTLFHWESQSRQSPEQPTVRRYIEHRERGTHVLLFARERKQGEIGTLPFTFLGPVDYVSHEGERPVSFTWRLREPMPEALFETARSIVAA